MELPALTIVHGVRDSGKTRCARDLADRCRVRGATVGGILSLAALVDGVKERYSYLDLAAGRQKVYAVRRTGPIPSGEPTFRFLDTGMAFGRSAIRRAARRAVQVLFVDEIGPLEMARTGLWEAVAELPGRFQGRLVLTVRSSLLETLRARLLECSSGLEITAVTPQEADRL